MKQNKYIQDRQKAIDKIRELVIEFEISADEIEI